MKDFFKKINWFYVAISIIYLVIGLICVIIPNKLTMAIPYIIGAILILNGILRLIGYFTNKNNIAFSFTNYAIAEGVLDIILGIIMFINTAISIVVVAVVIGIWALISGMLNINYAINKSESKPECILNFAFAVTQIVIGIVLFFNFSGGIAVSIVIAGIYFIFLCVSTILTKIVLFNKFVGVKSTVERALDPTHIMIKKQQTDNNTSQSTQQKNEQAETKKTTTTQPEKKQTKTLSKNSATKKPTTTQSSKKQTTSKKTKTANKNSTQNNGTKKQTSTKKSTNN